MSEAAGLVLCALILVFLILWAKSIDEPIYNDPWDPDLTDAENMYLSQRRREYWKRLLE